MKSIERKLETGLSGCKLELIGSNTLRKHSSSPSYNKRLDLQVKKQELFSNQVFRNVETPKVLSKGDSYFDMEYVTGRSFDEYFSVCSVFKSQEPVNTISPSSYKTTPATFPSLEDIEPEACISSPFLFLSVNWPSKDPER